MSVVRVLVVDDSATMRALLRHSLAADPGIAVIGEAVDPLDARQKIKSLDPDVITLDVEMPGMNGLEFLDKIMRLRPTPVIMVSNLTAPGASATIQALGIGAFDCIAKPNGEQGNTFSALPALIKEAAASKRRLAFREAPSRPALNGDKVLMERHSEWPELVAIGSSTGGVEVLTALLSEFPVDCPPTLIVQHLPASFTKSFAARLNGVSPAQVSEAQHGAPLLPGHVYLAPGGQHLSVAGTGSLRCVLSETDPVQGHRPSVDVMMKSVVKHFRGRMTGVILTGMGRDGAEGLLEMRQCGARTIAQDEATSLVYGMPRVAFEIGGAEKRVPLNKIVREVFR